jgi:hypothetical protein
MIGDSRDATVTIYGETCKLRVKRSNKTSWVAYGDFKGHLIRSKGRTAGAAVLDWRRKVENQQPK